MTTQPASPALAERIHDFVDELRARGVPISVVERIDGMRAVQLVDLASSGDLHMALGATVVKSAEYLPVFDEVFQLFFRNRSSSTGTLDELRSGDEDTRSRPRVALDLERAVRTVLRTWSAPLARQIAEQAVDQFSGFRPGWAAGGVLYEQRALAGLDLDAAADQAHAVLAPHSASPAGLGDRLRAREIADRVAALRQSVRDVIRERLVEDRGAVAVARTLRYSLTQELDIAEASPTQLLEIRRVMRHLERKLATTVTQRRRHRRGGRIDVRATIAKSLGSGGVPLRLVPQLPRPTKPQLYILADVSGSVANFAGFALSLIGALATLYSRLQAFAFAQGVAEVTDLLRTADDPLETSRLIRAAVAERSSGAYTDYGRSLREFHGAVHRRLEHRSTILIFGDGRANYAEGGVDALARLAERAGRVYWLNPEPTSMWGTGDSLMPRYAPLCTEAVSCRTLNDLRRFVERLG